MGRCYSVVADNLTMVGATTLMLIRPPATGLKEIELFFVELGMKSTATSAQARVELCTVTYAGAPTLTGVTPQPLDLGSPTSLIVAGGTGAAGTAGVNASAEGTPTRTVKHAMAFNVLNGWIWRGDDDGIVIPVGSASAFAVYFSTAPTDLVGWHCTAKYREK